MAKDRISMPSGQGGLMRYFEGFVSKVEFSPGGVIILAIVIMVIVILLHYFGGNMFLP